MLLQFIIRENNIEAILSAARKAMDAGINWIEIDAPDSIDNEQITSAIESLRQELADKGCVLIIGRRHELVKENQIDGVHIYSHDRPISAVRLSIEAWPIIGVNVSSKKDAESYRTYDIDYLFFESDGTPEALQTIREISHYLNENTIETPLVCGGDISPANAASHIEAGTAALATSDLNTLQEMKHITDNATQVNV